MGSAPQFISLAGRCNRLLLDPRCREVESAKASTRNRSRHRRCCAPSACSTLEDVAAGVDELLGNCHGEDQTTVQSMRLYPSMFTPSRESGAQEAAAASEMRAPTSSRW